MKNEKLYRVIDPQGGGFMCDTIKETHTENEIKERFWGLGDNRTDQENFTLEYIKDSWGVDIEEVTDYKNNYIENFLDENAPADLGSNYADEETGDSWLSSEAYSCKLTHIQEHFERLADDGEIEVDEFIETTEIMIRLMDLISKTIKGN